MSEPAAPGARDLTQPSRSGARSVTVPGTGQVPTGQRPSRTTNAAAAVRARGVTLPPWLWLAAIVVVSAGIRIALARRMVAPWIMIDEIVYSELAKSFAAHASFLVRGLPSHGYG